MANKKLFILSIDIGDGQTQKLTFREGDIAEEVGFLFCQQYGLDSPSYEFIVSNLKEKSRLADEENFPEEDEDPDDYGETDDNLEGDGDKILYDSKFED
jgi:hypothetical protein